MAEVAPVGSTTCGDPLNTLPDGLVSVNVIDSPGVAPVTDSEMIVLMVQVVLFLVMGIMCVRRVKSYLLSPRSASTENAARRLHRQIVVTAAVFFITFLPRATIATMKAVSNVRQDYAAGQCYGFCSDVVFKGRAPNCPIPFNMYFHMAVYVQYTPEFHLLVVLVASPLVQLVALWGMTS